jgi:antibiotic biosynthesis monooxygenase (ABM) superfamily enzyme
MTQTPDAAELPVTVAVTRHIDTGHADQMLAWIRAGSTLAERFPGFLGAGWVRAGTDSEDWHILYRFDSTASLGRWEASDQRAWWLRSAQGLVEESRKERRTGIEGWFDAPAAQDFENLSPGPQAPPRWKQMVMIWFAFFPLSLLTSWAFGRVAPDLDLLPKVLLSTVLMTPLMTYVVLPWLTRRLEWWLHGRPAPWRR